MHVVWAYTYTGQYAEAVRESRRALELAGVDPKLEPLHGDPRYVELLRSVGLDPVTRPIR